MSKTNKAGGRSSAYSDAEVDILLDCVQERLPMGADQWEQ
eukprot:CAMPEP_0174957818 /NCGR_PEP_ID=MMETSP0004_2-20121128/2281_1 /TAXON_ID=420556 /ORGANISM="Ochromonas sp., Strain CCMP1393" /LENGTH=39 /DNA_ID= /DNA_START= /DNA_END= /DNA_ORIENTATION=